MENSFLLFEIAFVVLLAIITGVAIVVDRIGNRIPYTVALVVVGLLIAFLPRTVEFPITKELILTFLVPPLVFVGALQVDWEQLRQNLISIVLLAVIGVALGTFVVGGVLITVLGIPAAAAFAFGALISATDPVAVIALFRELGVSKRLSSLVEGESLFNDGTAIVIFNLALAAGAAATLAPTDTTVTFNLAQNSGYFLAVAVGGLAVGLVVSMVVNYLIIRQVDNPLIETTVTMALAFGVFVIAEQIRVTESLHMSGILAVAAAGIYFGNESPKHMRPATRILVNNFWDLLSFIATSIIFLLIGLGIEIGQLVTPASLRAVGVAVVAVLFSRALVVYGLTFISHILGNSIPRGHRHVMYWGGLRGAVSLALALGIPAAHFGPENVGMVNQLRLMTFGVVLFTLLVQGTTAGRLIERLGLAHRPAHEIERQRRLGRLCAARAGRREIDRLHNAGVLSGGLWHALNDVYDEEVRHRNQEVQELMHQFPNLEPDLLVQARRAALRAERAALIDALRRDLVTESVQNELVQAIDAQLNALGLIEDHYFNANEMITKEA